MQEKYQQLPLEFDQAFKPADIRAIYPTQIDETVAYRTARAFVELYDLNEVVLGRDMRLSSPSLRDAFVEGLTRQGANVLDIGLVDTPGVYFISGTRNMFGAVITASHNPKDFNGIKLVKQQAIPLTDDLEIIKQKVIENQFTDAGSPGIVTEENILEAYKEFLHALVPIESSRLIKVIADAGNGMASLLALHMSEHLPVELEQLFFELDGTFPNRASNPMLAKNNEQIRTRIKEADVDFGVAFDGDVDRVAFFDENGKMVSGGVIAGMVAKHMLKEDAHQKMVYTAFSTRSFPEAIETYGGQALREKVGHTFIKKRMREEDAVFGAEHSGHFFFSNYFYADSGVLTYLYVLALYAEAAAEGKKFSDLVREFQKYHRTEEKLITVSDKQDVIDKAQTHFEALEPKHLDLFDGLYVVFDDFWFTIKMSVTEDALKFTIEATSKNFALEKQKELLSLIRNFDS